MHARQIRMTLHNAYFAACCISASQSRSPPYRTRSSHTTSHDFTRTASHKGASILTHGSISAELHGARACVLAISGLRPQPAGRYTFSQLRRCMRRATRLYDTSLVAWKEAELCLYSRLSPSTKTTPQKARLEMTAYSTIPDPECSGSSVQPQTAVHI